MRILLRKKLKRRINAIIYTSIFSCAAVIFTVSAFAAQDKTEYVIVEEPSSYAVSISGVSMENLAEAGSNEKTTTEETSTEQPTKDYSNYKGVFVSNTSGNLNIRESADAASDVVGVLEENNGGTVLEYGTAWTKIKSGKVTGYVATDYIAIGKKAKAILAQTNRVAVVNADTLMVRAKNNKNSNVIGYAGDGETFTIKEELDKWVKIDFNGETGYLSKEFVKIKTQMTYAKTLAEIEAKQEAEAESLAAEQEAEYESAQAAYEAESKAESYNTVETTAATQNSANSQSSNSTQTEQREASDANYDDTYLLACLVTCEAGNQPYEGKLAVANIVLNRVASSAYPNSISAVIYQSGQFGPAYTTLPARLQSGPDSGSLQAAQAALAGTNNVSGYLSFNVNSAVNTNSLNSYKIIGDHTFY